MGNFARFSLMSAVWLLAAAALAPEPVIEPVEDRYASVPELAEALDSVLASMRTPAPGYVGNAMRSVEIVTRLADIGGSDQACQRLPAVVAAFRTPFDDLSAEELAKSPDAFGGSAVFLGRTIQLARFGLDRCRANAGFGPDRIHALEADIEWARSRIAEGAAALALRPDLPRTELINVLDRVSEIFFPSFVHELMPVSFAEPAVRSFVLDRHSRLNSRDGNLYSLDVAELFSSLALAETANVPPAESASDDVRHALLTAIRHAAIRGDRDSVGLHAARLQATLPKAARRPRQSGSAGGDDQGAYWRCASSTLQAISRLGTASVSIGMPASCNGIEYAYQAEIGIVFYGRAMVAPEGARQRSMTPYLAHGVVWALAAGAESVEDPFGEERDIALRMFDADMAAANSTAGDDGLFRSLQLGTSRVTDDAVAFGSLQELARRRGASDLFEAYRTSSEEQARVFSGSVQTMAPPPPVAVLGEEPEVVRSVGGARTFALPEDEARLRNRTDAARRRLEQAVPEFAHMTSRLPVSLQSIQAALRSDEALLIVASTPFGTQSMAISNSETRFAASDWGFDRMQRAVDRLRFDLGADVVPVPSNTNDRWMTQSRGGRAFARSVSHAIHAEAVAPLESVIRGKQRLIVVAGGPLASLPFSVLVTKPPVGSDWDPEALRRTDWLSDEVAISHLASARSFLLLRQRLAPEPEPSHRFTFIGIGDPVTRGEERPCGQDWRGARALGARLRAASQKRWTNPADLIRSLPRLRCTATELQKMSDALNVPDSLLLTEERATEEVVARTDFSSADLIVFATHGLVGDFMSTRVTESALVLTPPDEVAPDEANDGFLLTSEVARLRLRADWVILSACNSGQGDDSSGLPLGGLTRAFLNAGARSVMVSYWPVSDIVAPLLTVEAVKLVNQSKGTLSKSEALRQAMRSVRNNREFDGPTGSFAHPTYWASFTMISD